MGPILTIALGIVLGYFLLFLITWLLGMIFFWLFGDRILPRVGSALGNAARAMNLDDTFGFEVADVADGTAAAASGVAANGAYVYGADGVKIKTY